MPTKLELTRASVDKCPRGLEQLQRGGPVITVTDTRAPPFLLHLPPSLSLSLSHLSPLPEYGIEKREQHFYVRSNLVSLRENFSNLEQWTRRGFRRSTEDRYPLMGEVKRFTIFLLLSSFENSLNSQFRKSHFDIASNPVNEELNN